MKQQISLLVVLFIIGFLLAGINGLAPVHEFGHFFVAFLEGDHPTMGWSSMNADRETWQMLIAGYTTEVITGFFFLMWGMNRKKYGWTGFWWGMSHNALFMAYGSQDFGKIHRMTGTAQWSSWFLWMLFLMIIPGWLMIIAVYKQEKIAYDTISCN